MQVYLNLRSLNVSLALGRPPLISHILLCVSEIYWSEESLSH